MADTPDITGTTQAGGQVPNVSGPAYEDTVQQDRQALADAHRRNLQMGLLAAGLGVLAYRPQRRERGALGHAIGEGGLMGLSTYQEGESEAEKELQARESARATQAFRSSELGLRQQELQATQDRDKATQDYRNAQIAAAARRDQETQDYRQRQQAIAESHLSLDSARTAAEITKDNADLAKTAQELRDSQPIGRDVFAPYRKSAFANMLPSPADTAMMPQKVINELRSKIVESYLKQGKGTTGTPKDIAQTIKSLTPKDYQVSRIEPDDTVVFENSGVTGSTIWGPVKVRVPGAFESLGPNASSGGGTPDSAALPIPDGSKPVYDGTGKLIGYKHD